MRSWLTYIFLLVVCSFIGTSCLDDSFENCPENLPVVQLRITLPGGGSRVGGDYKDEVYTDNLDPETTDQRMIAADDIYVLQFDKDGNLFHVVSDLEITGTNGDEERTLTGHLMTTEGEIKLVVLANLNEQDGINDITSQSLLENYKGKTETYIYNGLVYNYKYPENDKLFWKLDSRRLPMWGETAPFSVAATNNVSCNLYRGVAKMGIQVDKDCATFTLKEIYIYYANDKGFCAAPTIRPTLDANTQFTEPEIPSTASQLATAVKYEVPDGETNFLNKIYLPEMDNTELEEGKKELKVVVGGVYTGPGLVAEKAISYYRIDMEDDKNQDGVLAPFDIIRNHSYIFNITRVANPGTPTPEEALEEAVVGLTVEVEDWTEVPMQGITAQYTLTVDNSTFGFEGLTVTPGILNVTTDGTTWDYEKSQDVDNSWFMLGDINKKDNSGQITIIPSPNLTGAIRTGYFYVNAGKIGKKITVVQEPGETANCYIVRTPGDYLLKTDIKGNGNGQAWGDDTGNTKVDISLGTTGLNVDNVAILWETAEGLVTIKTNKPDKNGLITYTVKDKKDQWNTSVFEPGHGGNALIGGFDKDNKLVWSWHIWVVGDFANGIQTEQWVTGYDFMDRYLGAYSNEPGDRSLGLLYQWGRKDPFIGATNVEEARNHSQIVKAYTKNYTVHNVTYDWGDWTDGTDEDVQNSILNPTKILKSGFLSSGTGITEFDEKALWGTTSSSINVRENGVKTLYDPCPPGYRVPSVHSWIFSTTERYNYYGRTYSSSLNLYEDNYYYNSRFVPYRGKDGWDTGKFNPTSGIWEGGINDYGTESFTSKSRYYGFWIEYVANRSPKAIDVIQYNDGSADEGTLNNPADKNRMTWMPLGGVYSGTMDSFAKVGGNNFSSLQVNSIVWLNAPSHYNDERPAGVFLHGTEGYYNGKNDTGSNGNGRHIHRLNEGGNSLLALPQYAGSVRCIRDKDAVVSANNVISAQDITLNSTNNYSYTVKITAVETWRVSNPGAKWLSITPAKGNIGETTITISSSAPASGSETATITIQFARGGTKEIKVTRQ